MQMQADLANIPVIRARNAESTALGAALLAARGAGFAMDFEWQADRTFTPQISATKREEKLTQWRDALARI